MSSPLSVAENMEMLSLDKEWTLDFHGTIYIVNMSANNLSLLIDIEDAESADRWTFEFSASHVEDMTLKAGSYKKFEVFVRMLVSALSRNSDSVFVDVLTYSDLEILKARKRVVSPNKSSSMTNITVNHKSHLKRYLILTYAGEFDKVHYPLPLNFEDESSTEALKRTIARLRQRLNERDKDKTLNEDKDKLSRVMSQLRQENTELKHKLRQVERKDSSPMIQPQNNGKFSDLILANSRLQRKVSELKRQVISSSNDYERLRVQSAKEINKWRQLASQPQSSLINDSDSKDYTIRALRRKIADIEKSLLFERQQQQLRLSPSTYRSRSAPRSTTQQSSRIPSYLRDTSSSATRAERPRTLSPLTGPELTIKRRSDYRFESPVVRPPAGSTRQKLETRQSSRVSKNVDSGYSSANSQSSRGSDRSTDSRRVKRNEEIKAIRKKPVDRQPIAVPRFKDKVDRDLSMQSPFNDMLSVNSSDIERDSVDENVNTKENRIRNSNKYLDLIDKSINRSVDRSIDSEVSSDKRRTPMPQLGPQEGDIGEIDKKIKALQHFLDNARSGMVSGLSS